MLNFARRCSCALAVLAVVSAVVSNPMHAAPLCTDSASAGATVRASEPLLLAVGNAPDLPDSPAASSPTVDVSQAPASPAPAAPTLSPSKFVVKAGETAPRLTAGDKFHFATTNALSPLGFVGSIASAGLSHATDSRPHFGTDSAGFGERLGSTVYRSDVRAFFGFGVFPVLFHDDPRYYVLGDAAPFKQRVLYAATRIVVARKDSGARGVNYPRLLAPVVSQGSANGFYPSRDQDVTKTVTAILVSYAISAGGDEVKEFREDILRRLHHKH